ncbi:MAG: 1-acyl-sn-glycerol-3-phosphate acyltransferase [Lewinellaceae bacterium]|nr:1-acyl-sn-glycerol-3-phosphate acyltransferase [Saprospiraceae bacterium]MCB9340289.1 1-acyl-sn-glycerol-3-phosphate acyltransferase [Lewinellaceae bacterium]
MSEGSRVYRHVIPEIEHWPIYKLLADRKNFVEEIEEFTFQRLLKLHENDLQDIIAKTIYLERIRIKEEPWKVDPPNERMFWKKMSKRLLGKTPMPEGDEQKAAAEAVLRTIIHRYAEEIVGTFSIPTFLFARKFLTVFFNRLLNTAAGRNMKRIFGTKYKVYERLLTRGEIEKLRNLMTKGTVIVVPTHSSNLDSILIGYAMDTILGMPSFSYGAGLNLYNTGYTAYFMNRLGAYRVDRRKKNPIYLETLKTMSNLSIQRGTNTIFFPGGTRSRSGALEDKLKMGLLGTALEAQRVNFQKGTDEKVFIVPLIVSYHVVLEAKYLIEQYLRYIGKERYMKARDEFYSLRKLFKFGWKFFSQPSEITLSFGKPLDIMGNFVNEEGISTDRFGNQVEVKEYFMTEGAVTEDLQREMEYTKMLADRIVERYFKENIVLSSHVVAYAAFNILKNQNPRLDLFGVLRLPTDDYIFPMALMQNVVGSIRERLLEMNKNGKIKLSKQIFHEVDKLIEDGVRNLGVYHVEKPLVMNKKGQLVSEDFKLLYFYHNRLDNYGLEKAIIWEKVPEKEKLEMEVA